MPSRMYNIGGGSSKGFTVWFTGLSASGKTTLAFALEERLIDMGT